jgi:hypothetical protein
MLCPQGGGRAYPRDLHEISCPKWGYLPFFEARGLGHLTNLKPRVKVA